MSWDRWLELALVVGFHVAALAGLAVWLAGRRRGKGKGKGKGD